MSVPQRGLVDQSLFEQCDGGLVGIAQVRDADPQRVARAKVCRIGPRVFPHFKVTLERADFTLGRDCAGAGFEPDQQQGMTLGRRLLAQHSHCSFGIKVAQMRGCDRDAEWKRFEPIADARLHRCMAGLLALDCSAGQDFEFEQLEVSGVRGRRLASEVRRLDDAPLLRANSRHQGRKHRMGNPGCLGLREQQFVDQACAVVPAIAVEQGPATTFGRGAAVGVRRNQRSR